MKTILNPMISAAIAIVLVSVVAGANTTYYNPENITAQAPRAAMALAGLWSGNVTNSPLGPWPTLQNLLLFSSSDPFGNFYLRHPYLDQLMRFQGSLMQSVSCCCGVCVCVCCPKAPLKLEGTDHSVTTHKRYCFQNATTAPFELVDSDDPNELKVCWRRDVPRVPSLKANCTGCDCAVWTIEKTGNVSFWGARE